MTIKSILDCERENLKKLDKYQLPHYFRKVGAVLFLFCLAALFINKYSINDFELKLIIKYGIMIGLLLISVSKEKIEDELITRLRMQSYTFAFIIGVLFILLLPIVDLFFNLILNESEAGFSGLGDWQILWLLLSIQVFYFELLKRLHK